jgi:hypothetical protein
MEPTDTGYHAAAAVALAFALILVAAVVPRTGGSPADCMALAVSALMIIGAIGVIASNKPSKTYRLAVSVALLTTLILFWVIGAVGLLGPENGRNTADLIYLGVPAVGVIGAIIARCRPRGTARAMFATALAVLSLPVILVAGLTPLSPNIAGDAFPHGLLLVHAPFAALYLGSGWLFRKSMMPPEGNTSGAAQH